jgi:hypothetical protein
MQNIQPRFQGLFIPHVTPFDESGALDTESLERLTTHFASLNNVAGLVSCARIGEGPVLRVEEKRCVYERVGKIARNAAAYIATIAPQSLTKPSTWCVIRIRTGGCRDDLPPLLFAWCGRRAQIPLKISPAANLPLVLFRSR